MRIKKLLGACVAIFLSFGLIACTTNENEEPIEETAKYVVIFNYKNGDPSTSFQVQDGEKVTKPTEPQREGFKFLGWYLDESLKEAWDFDKNTVYGNITLYAGWEEILKYSIFYYIQGHGQAPADVLEATNLPNPLPEIEDVEGWHFAGWYLEENCTTLAVAGKVLTENVSLYAKWEEVVDPALDVYSICFDMHGHGEAPADILGVTKLPDILPEIEDVEGWHFVGWYLEGSYITLAEPGKELTNNVILHAKWEEKIDPTLDIFSICFDMHGHGEAPADILGVTKLPDILPEIEDVEGWHFIGWYLEDNYITLAEPGKELTNNVILHAKWEEILEEMPEKYSISYNMHNHGEKPEDIVEATSLPNPLPEIEDVEGWHFVGWYLEDNYITLAEAGKELTNNVILHAKWEEILEEMPEKYSISYNINGKGEQPTNIKEALALPEELPVLSANGYVFAGWYLDSDFSNKATPSMQLTEDVTLYAKWVEKDVLVIDKAIGYSEGAYLEWETLEGCEEYNVYYKKQNESDSSFKKIDEQLIRQYPTKYRADILGLAAGNYTIKVIPVYENEESVNTSAQENVIVSAHDRSGFGFSKNSTYKTASGAYNDDGTLKNNAQVIYVSANNAKTVTCTINGTMYTGIQAILEGKQKGDTTPLCIRLIGLIQKSDLDYIASAEEGLQVKGKNGYAEMNLTIEGIGEDATCKGFGFLIRNCGNVEFRNLAIMDQMDDAISIDTNNCNLWIHHLDLYYGQAGGDSDQAKGDGFIDVKKSQYCSISYNHFYDSGKSCLVDASEASSGGSDYLTYHHNWFDHSDSRHPRVRNGKNIHIYNNYYDGVSKYGIGATTSSSVFVEANYFRNVKYPMMIAGQGSDVDPKNAKGTFSGEVGGMIKSYNNKIVEGGTFISQNDDPIEFDAVDVANRNDKVTNYSCKKGGGTYSNFDTDPSIMYTYAPNDVDDVVRIVTSNAGRINGGDFHWTFDNKTQDDNYSVIPELKQAIASYCSTLIRVLGIEGIQNGGTGGTGDEEKQPGTGEEDSPVISDNIVHNFTTDSKESSVFTITGNLSTGKGEVTYKGLKLTQCLKLESATKIDFNISSSMTLILVFVESSATIKVNGTKYTATNGIISVILEPGAQSITKADGANLFYIELVKSE